MLKEYTRAREAIYNKINDQKKGFISVIVSMFLLTVLEITLVVLFMGTGIFWISGGVLAVLFFTISTVFCGIMLIMYLQVLYLLRTRKITKFDFDTIQAIDRHIINLKKQYIAFGLYEDDEHYLLEFLPFSKKDDPIVLLIRKDNFDAYFYHDVLEKIILDIKKRCLKLAINPKGYRFRPALYVDNRKTKKLMD